MTGRNKTDTVPLSVFLDLRNDADDLRRQVNDLLAENRKLRNGRKRPTAKERERGLKALTKAERHIAVTIAESAPSVVSLERIAEGWPGRSNPSPATIMVLMSRVRDKLGDIEVQVLNKHGQGYWMSLTDAKAVLS